MMSIWGDEKNFDQDMIGATVVAMDRYERQLFAQLETEFTAASEQTEHLVVFEKQTEDGPQMWGSSFHRDLVREVMRAVQAEKGPGKRIHSIKFEEVLDDEPTYGHQ